MKGRRLASAIKRRGHGGPLGHRNWEHVRSLLFAPGDHEQKLSRALRSQADAVIADLEDAVAPEAKSNARAVLADAFEPERSACLRIVRVNSAETSYFEEDIALASGLSLDGLMLPKATYESAAAVSDCGIQVIALIETAAGLNDAYRIASLGGVHLLALGGIDLAADLGLEPRSDGQQLLYARSKLAVDSAAAGIRPPIDTVYVAFRDLRGLEAESTLARSLGMGGKLCIHPDQVAIVNKSFAPSPEEVRKARSVVKAYGQSLRSRRGVTSVGQEMVDLASVRWAQRVLASVRKSPEDKGFSRGDVGQSRACN